MKDVEGHGSNARGRVQPKTPGVHMTMQKAGSFTYPTIFHTPSGSVLRAMTEHPLEMSQRDFADKLDKALAGVDWTRSKDDLRYDPAAATKVFALHGLQRK